MQEFIQSKTIYYIINIYSIYILIRDYIKLFINQILKLFNKQYSNKIISINYICNDNLINLPNDLNINNIQNYINNNSKGYIKIKFIENNKKYIQIVPWNQNINEETIEYLNNDSNNIKLLSCPKHEIIYASTNNGDDISNIIEEYLPHLNEYTYTPTFGFNGENSVLILDDISLKKIKYLIPDLCNKNIEIYMSNNLTIHI